LRAYWVQRACDFLNPRQRIAHDGRDSLRKGTAVAVQMRAVALLCGLAGK
jgi:hypothetical protein